MIIYQSTRRQFLEDSERDAIEDVIARAYLDKTKRYAGESEYRAWRHSLMQMADVLRDDDMPASMGIGIEFCIPQTAKRIDFLLSGSTDAGERRLVIVELKQWSSSRISEKDGIVFAQRGGRAESEGPHPSYQ